MFGFGKPRLPVSLEIAQWVDEAFAHLARLLGPERMRNVQVLLPIDRDFPDRFDGTEASVAVMMERIAEHMQISLENVRLGFFDDDHEELIRTVPFAERKSQGVAGFYRAQDDGSCVVALKRRNLQDPTTLVATIAHELGHVLLLGRDLVSRDADDMEPMNDVLTVFLGLGVFSANASFQFSQFTTNQSQGWSVRRHGYLPEPVWGYALARFAYERKETKPEWANYLSRNIAEYFKASLRWMHAAK